MKDSKYPMNQVIERLANDLNLTKGDGYTQEWECEAADVNRIQDFLSYYEKTKLNSNEEVALMRLILESYNEYVYEFGYNSAVSNKLEQLLSNEKTLYGDIIDYWACGG